MKVVLLSCTEGDDKPLKYPLAFCLAQTVVLTKVDLLPYVDFDVQVATANTRRLNPESRIITVACRAQTHSEVSLDAWLDFVRELAADSRSRRAARGKALARDAG